MANLTIANTIWQQITAGGMIKVWSWGVPMNSRVGHQEKDGSGWLRFKVSGMKFKGIVKVIYRPVPDDYMIEFHKPVRKKNAVGGFDTNYEVIKSIEGVYCDTLTTTIDEFVEKIEKYKW